MTRVDPFVPVHGQQPKARPGLTNNIPQQPTTRPKTARSVDGMRVVPASPSPVKAATTTPRPFAAPPAAKKPAKKPKRQRPGKFAKLQSVLLVLMIVLGGFLIQQSVVVGEACIALYAVVALKQRVAPRLTFLLALLAFIGVIILLVFRANATLANNFALYSFLLLAVGLLCYAREAWANR